MRLFTKERPLLDPSGVRGLSIADTPIAVVDLETTGLVPGADRVLEISIVRLEPDGRQHLALDTLVNPDRLVAATEIHGITDDDVEDAPRFRDIAGDVVGALSGAVVAAYNVYFDMRFLDFELTQVGVRHSMPHFCLMYLRPMLKLGKKCRLEVACKEHEISYDAAHIAAMDANACGELLRQYLTVLSSAGILTFGDLAKLHKYKFTESFTHSRITADSYKRLRRSPTMASRAPHVDRLLRDRRRLSLASYWDTLTAVVADFEISEDEIKLVFDERQRLQLSEEQIRTLHARVLANAITQFTDDEWLDDDEVEKLHRLQLCLSRLGWAPGDH